MINPLPDEVAFSPHLTPNVLWRASCPWAAHGHDTNAEWLHEMAVSLMDIQALPEHDSGVREKLLGQQLTDPLDIARMLFCDEDIPF